MSGSGPKRPKAGKGLGRASQRPRVARPAPPAQEAGQVPWSPRRKEEAIVAPSEGATGRKIEHDVPTRPAADPTPVQHTKSSGRPFDHYRLAEDAYRYIAGQGGAASSVGFAGIVTLASTLTIGALMLAGGVQLYAAWAAYQQGPIEDTVAQAEARQRRVFDESKLMNQRRAGKAAAAARPTPAPVSMNVPSGVYFHELEVVCEETGFRSRGRFYGGRATVLNVPPETLCWARLMGSEQARWPVYAGQTFDCTFDPVRCEER